MEPGDPPRRDLWAEAAKSLNPKEQSLVETSFKDRRLVVQDVLVETERQKKVCEAKQLTFTFRGKPVVLRDLFGNMMNWINKFKGALDFLVSMDVSGHAAAPWMVIKFCLEAAGKDIKKHGDMLMGLEHVTQEIEYYGFFEGLYLQKNSDKASSLSEVLVKAYTVLLRELAGIKKYFTDRTIPRFMKALFDDGGIASMTSEADSLRKRAQEIGNLIVTEQSQSSFNSLSQGQQLIQQQLEGGNSMLTEVTNRLSQMDMAAERMAKKQVLDWISPLSHSKYHQEAKEGRLEGTGHWLLDNADFQAWKQPGEDVMVFWLHGLAGTGKTTLSSLVIDHLLAQQENGDGLGYFYCIRDTAQADRADPVKILRSLAKQLSLNSDLVREEAKDKYNQATSGGLENVELTLGEVTDLLVKLAEPLASVTIIIDALDECELTDTIKLLGQLGAFSSSVQSTSIRILLVSRPMEQVSNWVQKSGPNKDVEVKGNSKDIELFVKTQLDKMIADCRIMLGEVPEKTKEDIVRRIVEGAGGMFRWAALRLGHLLDLVDEEDVESELSKPVAKAELSDLYDISYQKMSKAGPNAMTLVEAALKLLMCLQQPLHKEGVLSAVNSLRDPKPGTKDLATRDLLRLCPNFLIEESDVIRFAHQSVREYLASRAGYSSPEVHAVAARIALNRISTLKPARKPVRATTSFKRNATHGDQADEDPLTAYATIFWPYHLQEAADQRKVGELGKLTKNLRLSSRPYFVSWMSKLRRAIALSLSGVDETTKEKLDACLSDPPSAFFLACAFGIIEALPESKAGVPETNETGMTGLHVACKYGHLEIVKRLLDLGIDTNKEDWSGRTPLWYAFEDRSMVNEMLARIPSFEVSESLIVRAFECARDDDDSGDSMDLLKKMLKQSGDKTGPLKLWEAALTARNEDVFEWLLLDEFGDVRFPFRLVYKALEFATPKMLDLVPKEYFWYLRSFDEKYLDEDPDPDLNIDASYYVAAMRNPAPEAMLQKMLDMRAAGSQVQPIEDEAFPAAILDATTDCLRMLFEFNEAAGDTAAERASDDPLWPLLLKTMMGREGGRRAEVLDCLIQQGLPDPVKLFQEKGLDLELITDTESCIPIFELLEARNLAFPFTARHMSHARTWGNEAFLEWAQSKYPQLQGLGEELSQKEKNDQTSMLTTFVERILDLQRDPPDQHEALRVKRICGVLIKSATQVGEMELKASAAASDLSTFKAMLSRCRDQHITEDLIRYSLRNSDLGPLEFMLAQAPDLPITGETVAQALRVGTSRYGIDMLLHRVKHLDIMDVLVQATLANNQNAVYVLRKCDETANLDEECWGFTIFPGVKDVYPSLLAFRALLELHYLPRELDELARGAARDGLVEVVRLLSAYSEQEDFDASKWLSIAREEQKAKSGYYQLLNYDNFEFPEEAEPRQRTDVDGD